MRKIIFSFISIIFAVSATSQGYVDSLKIELSKTKADTSKIKILLELTEFLSYSAPETAMKYAQNAQELSKKTGKDSLEIESLIMVGHILSVMGNTKAIQVIIEAKRKAEKINSNDLISTCYNVMGNIHSLSKDYQNGIDNYMNSLKYGGPSAGVYSNLSWAYVELNNTDSALYYFQEGYKLAIAKKDWKVDMLGGLYVNAGKIHAKLNNNELAIAYFQKAIASGYSYEDWMDVSDGARGLGNIYLNKNQRDSAKKYFYMAVDAEVKMNFPIGLEETYSSMIKLYRGINTDSSLKYMQLAYDLKDSLFGVEKLHFTQALNYEERVHEENRKEALLKAAHDQKLKLEFAIIAIIIVCIMILFLLFSHSIIANAKLIKFLGIVNLLFVFEFLNLFLHPILGDITGHSPFLTLIIMVGLASLLIPLHHKMEHWVTNQLVEKNNKIKLKAAQKIIEDAERD